MRKGVGNHFGLSIQGIPKRFPRHLLPPAKSLECESKLKQLELCPSCVHRVVVRVNYPALMRRTPVTGGKRLFANERKPFAGRELQLANDGVRK